MFAAFIILPTRFWPRIDRELPFLAIALFFYLLGYDNMNMLTYVPGLLFFCSGLPRAALASFLYVQAADDKLPDMIKGGSPFCYSYDIYRLFCRLYKHS